MGSGDFPASFLQDHVRSGGRNVRPGRVSYNNYSRSTNEKQHRSFTVHTLFEKMLFVFGDGSGETDEVNIYTQSV